MSEASQHATVLRHLERALEERILPAAHVMRRPVSVGIWESGMAHTTIQDAVCAAFKPIEAGDAWGIPWHTAWFKVVADVPPEWEGMPTELLIDLGFNHEQDGFQAEGLAYDSAGRVLKGVNPNSAWVPIASSEGPATIYVEAAANPTLLPKTGENFDFRPTVLGDPDTVPPTPQYKLGQCQVAVRDAEVWELCRDLEVARDLVGVLPPASSRRHQILESLAQAMSALDFQAISATARNARATLAGALDVRSPVVTHQVSAVGHAHIDSAWLWPFAETARKVARTVANVLDLMDSDETFIFAMSQAQQFSWLKESHPALYARVKERVAQGRFVPVGGMWVESDANMPSGESLVRQLTYGKRFFLDEFGIETKEVWLPDSFGFSASLPQIFLLSGSRWFVTQKLSWNSVNDFPFHTFYWEGIDGSRILSHLPPAETYSAKVTGGELTFAESNFAQKALSKDSLLLFGYGDGGGGPTREMLGRLERFADLDGVPRVSPARPDSFFRQVEQDFREPPVWLGELYLEAHRGTYTTQARTKEGNRRTERLLHEAELWATHAALLLGIPYPYRALDSAWRRTLLLQFHDVLPGSSIGWVHRETESMYEVLADDLNVLIDTSLGQLVGDGELAVMINASPLENEDVPGSSASLAPTRETRHVAVTEGPSGWELDNGAVRVAFGRDGHIESIFDVVAGREVVPKGAQLNTLHIYSDTPAAWDAWDIDPDYRRSGVRLDSFDHIEVDRADDSGAASISVKRSFSGSTFVQTTALRPGEASIKFETRVEWNESERLLRARFPVEVRAERYASEQQFGHVFRPTHTNTAWDTAKFEVCAHRWVHVSEPGYGVALVNDRTYGHDVVRPTMSEGRAGHVVLGMSLLRAPRYPDPTADRGSHTFRYELAVGVGITQAVERGYAMAYPIRTRSASRTLPPLVRVSGGRMIVETLKLADDRSGDLVVRVYEPLGARCKSVLSFGVAFASASVADLLERPLDEVQLANGGQSLSVQLAPFEIRTLRLRPGQAAEETVSR